MWRRVGKKNDFPPSCVLPQKRSKKKGSTKAAKESGVATASMKGHPRNPGHSASPGLSAAQNEEKKGVGGGAKPKKKKKKKQTLVFGLGREE